MKHTRLLTRLVLVICTMGAIVLYSVLANASGINFANPSANSESFFSAQVEMINSYYNYNELNLPAGQKSSEYGYVPGVSLTLMYRNPFDESDYRFNVSFANTNLTYDGTDNGGNPLIGSSTARFLDASALMDIYTIKNWQTELYLGVGYHSWERGVCMASSSGGYTENYSWGYMPIGLRRRLDLSDNLSIEPDLSGRIMFAGQIAIPAYNANLNLGNRFGVDFRAPIEYRIDEMFSALITPWIDYSEIGKSNTSSSSVSVYEPDSCTWQGGVNIGIKVYL